MIVLGITIWCVIGIPCLMYDLYADFGYLDVGDVCISILCCIIGIPVIIFKLLKKMNNGTSIFDKRIL